MGRWIQGGYFLVKDGKSQDGRSPLRRVTLSSCVSTSYPDGWALPWWRDEEHRREARAALGLDEQGFAELLAWTERALEDRRFGRQNVFLELAPAREFHRRFLAQVSGVRLLGLGLEEGAAADFLRDEGPTAAADPGTGIWLALGRHRRVEPGGTRLGFDVLGVEYDCDLHSFSCNDLERHYHRDLGISLNAFGLIDDAEDAVRAAEYSNRDDVPAEPVPWYAGRLDEYSLPG